MKEILKKKTKHFWMEKRTLNPDFNIASIKKFSKAENILFPLRNAKMIGIPFIC